MKKAILLFSFIVFTFSLFSQTTLSWKDKDAQDKVSVEAKQDEAEVRIYSSLPLTFNSITKVKEKNTAAPFKVEKEGPLNVYYFLFSSLSQYSDRKLKINSNGYKSIEIPLQLVAYAITAYHVWDEEKEGVKGGNRLFKEGKYDQAKIMYLDAMERVGPEDQEEENTIMAHLDKLDSCVIAKETADKYYNNKEWTKAKDAYGQVIAINPTDKFCQERKAACIREFENTPRIITGKVTDGSGNALAGVNIVPLENGKKGLRTVTDASGAYQVKTVNKTTELVYWKDSLDKEKKLQITGDVMNFVAK